MAEQMARCSCGNEFDGDNLCMPSACQWEGIESAVERCRRVHGLEPGYVMGCDECEAHYA